ncbi:MAG: methionyl-tRNA formyltransferase [Patescibacteria group bacterium]
MKIAFFGTPAFTTAFLEKLTESGFGPSLIVTNPDRPSGRGMILQAPQPKVWGQKHNISVLQPEIRQLADDEFLANLGEWDLFIVVAYGKILPEKLITLPKYGTINIHYSLLPKYRGATPVESAILNGDEITGVVIQQMRYKLDTGPILSQKKISIAPNDTTLSLREKLNNEALIMLPDVLKKIFDQKIEPEEQSEEGASHCKKIAKEDGEIDLDDDGVINDRKYRAYYGSPGTFFFTKKHDKKIRVKINKAHLTDGKFIIDEVTPENGKRISYESL